VNEPKRPPKALIPRISLQKWKPDERAMDVALGKKPEEKRDRGKDH
jgi:hypothetical protein